MAVVQGVSKTQSQAQSTLQMSISFNTAPNSGSFCENRLEASSSGHHVIVQTSLGPDQDMCWPPKIHHTRFNGQQTVART